MLVVAINLSKQHEHVMVAELDVVLEVDLPPAVRSVLYVALSATKQYQQENTEQKLEPKLAITCPYNSN